MVDRDEQNREFYSCANTPFRHHSKDILSIVGSFLFGVGCGTLTATTLFLVWSLFAYNHYEEESDCDFGSDESDGEANPKKMGYLAIPPAEAPTSTPHAKEVLRELCFPAAEIIVFRMGELRGLLKWRARFKGIGLDETLSDKVTEEAGILLVQVERFMRILSSVVQQFSNFFAWLLKSVKMLMSEPSDQLLPFISELVILFLKFLYDQDPVK